MSRKVLRGDNMNHDNSVIFKAKKDKLIIILDKSVSFDILKEELILKIDDSKGFFYNSKLSIFFKGRELSDIEEEELIKIISNNSEIKISYVHDDEFVLKNNNTIKSDGISFESMTKYHKGTLRSGQSIVYDGSVFVFGDVNPGSEIIATGNIIVFGTLKGIVHAGADLNDKAFIVAMNMTPIQLRIGKTITRCPDNMSEDSKKTPHIAYLNNNNIYIEPVDSKIYNIL